jgi:hypothetical protein
MLTETLCALFRRDLDGLRHELQAYPDEASVWQAVPGLTNSSGVLVRHLCGNLQHFVGTVLGATGYVRDREGEFGAPPWERRRLLAEIDATERAVLETLPRLTVAQLAGTYPQSLNSLQLETADFLVHLAVHLGFHLGQVGYHRRAATGSATSVGPVSLAKLASARRLDPETA